MLPSRLRCALGPWIAGRSSPVAITLACALAACSAPATDIDGDQVAMFRGDEARLGHYDVPAIRNFGGLQWRFATDGPVRSTPVVAYDNVYVGSSDGHLYAIHLDSGDPVWTFDAESSISSSPAVAFGLVYFTARNNSLYAVNARTGQLSFRIETGADMAWAWGHESADLWTSSPAVTGDLVIFGSGDGKVYAADARTGRIRWTFLTGGRVRSSPAIRDGRVFIGSMDGSVHIIDIESGAEIARADTEGRELFSGDFGFDRRSIQSTPAVTADRILVGAKDGFLYAFARDGAQLWRNDHQVSWILGGPAVSDGLVFDGSSDGRFVQAVDITTGEEVWRFQATGTVWMSPAVADGVVYAGDGGGWMFAIDATTGAELWRFLSGGAVQSSPVPAGDLLLFGSDDGAVYALHGADRPLDRAVYWDSAAVRLTYYRDTQVRDALVSAQYARLDNSTVTDWLRLRTRERTPSVIVFALDRLPDALLPDAQGGSPLLDYLNSGGKVVWVGTPPLLRRVDSETRTPPSLLETGWAASSRFIGVDYGPAIFDYYAATPTEEGRRWGLTGGWPTRWSAAHDSSLTALAIDERGDAPIFVRPFGGPAGTGFVQIWPDSRPVPDAMIVRAAAEYRPR